MKIELEKFAVIRGNDANKCPFGLPIPTACECAGESVRRMTPINAVEEENDKNTLTKANKLVYIYNKDGNKCPFADKILKQWAKVDCDFGDTAEGEDSVPLSGSPLYPRTFSGLGYEALSSTPLGFYTDQYPARNMFYGLFSFLGSQKVDQIVKLANAYDECGHGEDADKIDKLLKDIEDIRDENDFESALLKIEEILAEFRDRYQDSREDTGLLYELAKKWYGPRQMIR